jgi:hypothetical protein
MPHFTISGHAFQLEEETVSDCMLERLPDPVHEHYVVISGRRFPPKQVLACVTGLDRADFTTHQARRILRRLGFVVARLGAPEQADSDAAASPIEEQAGTGPFGGRQADALRPYLGQWVALGGPTEVLVAADSPQKVLAWLSQHNQRAPYGMFRVPATVAEAEGAAPA